MRDALLLVLLLASELNNASSPQEEREILYNIIRFACGGKISRSSNGKVFSVEETPEYHKFMQRKSVDKT